MSDLIEKTAKAIEAEIAKRKGVFDSRDISRAAIAAVAEWLDGIGKHTAAAELRAGSIMEAAQ